MTEEFALAYIPKRMEELGYGKNYLPPKFRHFSLNGGETRIVNAYNEYFMLITADADMVVLSEFGAFDLSDDTINEQLYEHQGEIIIANNSVETKQITFIQVIPKHF